MTRSISIVLPAYNEETRLPATLQAIMQYLRSSNWSFAEVIVVDDGSADDTAGVAEQFAGKEPAVRVLRNPSNRGKGYSVRRGMLAARGEWALLSDADLSAPIEEVEKLWQAAQERGARVAIGSRALNRALIERHQSTFREYGGRVFNCMLRVITGLPFWDTQCGFKLFEAESARQLFGGQRLEGFGFDAEVLFIARLLSFLTVEVPVRWSHVDGTKVHFLRDSVEMFVDLLRIRRNQLAGCYRFERPADRLQKASDGAAAGPVSR